MHTDAPAIDTLFVNQSDLHVNDLEIKGIREIAAIGVAPAIAVFNATGKRVRELPITRHKLA